MEQIVLLIFVAGFLGLLICVPMSVALWAVLGQSHFLIRLSGLILCILAVGTFFDSTPSARSMEKIAVASLYLFLCFAIWAFQSWLARVVIAFILVATLCLMIRNAGHDFFDPQSFGAAAIAIPLGALLVFTFRWLGFRFVRLTGAMSDQQIEIGTGKRFDAWLAELRAAGAETMTRVEIVDFFRQRGVPFTYQRVLTDAYEMSIGRRIVSVAADGMPQTVLAYSGIGKAAVEHGDKVRSRWSLSQLMILSSVAALLFALARALQIQVPEAGLLGVLTLTALCCSVIAVPVLAAELSVETHLLNRVVYLCVAIGVAASYPRMIGLWSQSLAAMGAALTVFSYTAWLVAAVILVRHHGCRIVLVGRPERP